jgi:transmembrane sensor
MKRTLREDEVRIATEAARWQQALAGADESVRAEFTDWLKASPRHVREFMFMEALDAAAVDADPDRTLELATDLSGSDESSHLSRPSPFRLSRDPSSEPSVLGVPPYPPLRASFLSRRLASGLGLAAAMLVCVAAGGYWWMNVRNTYVTDVGEQRSVRLPDGSMMHLNTDSRAVVQFSESDRAIRLESGEALFRVERDAGRPFEVLTPSARIRVLGTEFNVREIGAATRVAVVDGAVKVSPAELSPFPLARASSHVETMEESPAADPAPASGKGEEILKAGDEANIEQRQVVKSRKPNIERAVAWRARRLVFQEESLGAIADEFNRYNRAPRIVIEGDQASGRRYGGTFNADDPQSLVRLVTRTGDLQAEQRGDEIIIRGH